MCWQMFILIENRNEQQEKASPVPLGILRRTKEVKKYKKAPNSLRNQVFYGCGGRIRAYSLWVMRAIHPKKVLQKRQNVHL